MHAYTHAHTHTHVRAHASLLLWRVVLSISQPSLRVCFLSQLGVFSEPTVLFTSYCWPQSVLPNLVPFPLKKWLVILFHLVYCSVEGNLRPCEYRSLSEGEQMFNLITILLHLHTISSIVFSFESSALKHLVLKINTSCLAHICSYVSIFKSLSQNDSEVGK